jgi:hypothetical protein
VQKASHLWRLRVKRHGRLAGDADEVLTANALRVLRAVLPD